MIELVVAHLVGLVAGAVAWRAMAPVFAHELFRRQNYRSHELSTSSGLAVAVAALGGAGVAEVLQVLVLDRFELQRWSLLTTPVALLVAGFALLGLLDDLVGVGESGGFRGHLSAMARGRLTTGGLKLVIGALVAVAAVRGLGDGTTVGLLRDAALVSLAANLANLLDRAPGRVIKAGEAAALASAGAMVLVGTEMAVGALAPVLFVAGAALALLPPDLREVSMLGDAGSNVIGAVLGLGVLVVASPDGVARWVVLAVVLALNLASEVVSFSKVIDATPPLRWLDRWGSPHRS